MPPPVEVPWPAAGLNTNTSFDQQPPRTTADCLNVLPYDAVAGRDRGSRRSGTSKRIPDLAPGAIQELGSLTLAVDQTTGTGDVLTALKGTPAGRIYGDVAGATLYTGPTALLSDRSVGCTDEDNNFYVASVSGANVRITKYGTDYPTAGATAAEVEKWTTNKTMSGNATLWGIAAFEGVVYVYIVPLTTGSMANEGVYRFDQADGVAMDANQWVGTTSGLGAVADVSLACQCCAAGDGLVAVVNKLSGSLSIQIINIATRTVTSTTAIQAFDAYESKLITDAGGNFYVLTNIVAAGAVNNKLFKFNFNGVAVAAFNAVGAVDLGNKTHKDIAYDPLGFAIGVCGTNVTASAGKSFATINATTGVLVATFAPGTVTTWLACASGTASSWRLRKGTAANDLIKFDSTLTTVWSITTAASATTERLWLQCAGSAVAPTGQYMQSTRKSRIYSVANGGLDRIESGRRVNVATTFLSTSAPVVYSTVLNGIAYFTDGRSIRTYNGFTNQIGTLTATAGSIPTDVNGNYPRIIETWRNRLCLFSLVSDAQNWFFPAIDDPSDFDYTTQLETSAYAGTDSGMVPDVVNGFIPFTNDVGIFLCDHTVYQFNGDPGSGGRIDLRSSITGGAWGRAWCKDPNGNAYFFGSRGSVYRIAAGGVLERISRAIDSDRLFGIDLSANLVRMVWEDRWEGIHIFITPLDRTLATTHYWWDAKTGQTATFQVIQQIGSWWPIQFSNPHHNPLAVATFDGDSAGDRIILLGGADGAIRVFDPEAEGDDGTPITSRVKIGPVVNKGGAFRLTDLQCTLASDSGPVNYSLAASQSVEAAFSATEVDEGRFYAGRNASQAIRRRGHAAFVNMQTSELARRWSIERLATVVEPLPAGPAQRSW